MTVGERAWEGMQDLIEKGIVKEAGFFLNGTSGYATVEEESAIISGIVAMFMPYWEIEVQEIVTPPLRKSE